MSRVAGMNRHLMFPNGERNPGRRVAEPATAAKRSTCARASAVLVVMSALVWTGAHERALDARFATWLEPVRGGQG